MSFLRTSFLSRICRFALLILLINISIDPRDNALGNAPEDLTLNDIESMAEFICEEVFGLTGAFQESDEADSETVSSNVQKVFFVSNKLEVKLSSVVTLFINFVIENTATIDLFKSEISIPPPR